MLGQIEKPCSHDKATKLDGVAIFDDNNQVMPINNIETRNQNRYCFQLYGLFVLCLGIDTQHKHVHRVLPVLLSLRSDKISAIC